MRVLVFSSLLTHQSRDAIRRGYSFWPVDISTPAMPYFAYLVLLTVLPQFNQWMVSFHDSQTTGDNDLGERSGCCRENKPRKYRQPVTVV